MDHMGQAAIYFTVLDGLNEKDEVVVRAGFLAHDGYIYETLVGRGGILVAIHSEPRAADALAKLHSYGGGNAAIGAWNGRLNDSAARPA